MNTNQEIILWGALSIIFGLILLLYNTYVGV